MKLLLDQNLSYRLVAMLEVEYPGTKHVRQLQADREDDPPLWARCRRDGFVLVTKDTDFEDARLHPGPPPKVVLLLVGNTATGFVQTVLRRNAARIRAFELDGERVLRLK